MQLEQKFYDFYMAEAEAAKKNNSMSEESLEAFKIILKAVPREIIRWYFSKSASARHAGERIIGVLLFNTIKSKYPYLQYTGGNLKVITEDDFCFYFSAVELILPAFYNPPRRIMPQEDIIAALHKHAYARGRIEFTTPLDNVGPQIQFDLATHLKKLEQVSSQGNYGTKSTDIIRTILTGVNSAIKEINSNTAFCRNVDSIEEINIALEILAESTIYRNTPGFAILHGEASIEVYKSDTQTMTTKILDFSLLTTIARHIIDKHGRSRIDEDVIESIEHVVTANPTMIVNPSIKTEQNPSGKYEQHLHIDFDKPWHLNRLKETASKQNYSDGRFLLITAILTKLDEKIKEFNDRQPFKGRKDLHVKILKIIDYLVTSTIYDGWHPKLRQVIDGIAITCRLNLPQPAYREVVIDLTPEELVKIAEVVKDVSDESVCSGIEHVAICNQTAIVNNKTEQDQSGKNPHEAGAKLDQGKPLAWTMLSGFSNALAEVAKVTTVGATKYTPNGWVDVPNGEQRYMEAFARHMLALGQGEQIDQDTQCLHKAQMVWDLLASLELELRGKKMQSDR